MEVPNQFLPTTEWPLQENYKLQLHEYIQRWGERVAPAIEALEAEDRAPREKFFEWLMDSVRRSDPLTSDLIKNLDLEARQSIGYSYYRETMEYVPESHPMLSEANQRQFETLFALSQLDLS